MATKKNPQTKARKAKGPTVATGRKSRAKTSNVIAKRYKRATFAEMEQRILTTMRMVILGLDTIDIKMYFRVELGIQWHQALRYLRLARARLAEETGLTEEFTIDDMKRQHYAMAMRAARKSPEAKDRLEALKLPCCFTSFDQQSLTHPSGRTVAPSSGCRP